MNSEKELMIRRLYESFFLSFDGANLRDLPEEHGFDKVAFDNLLGRMLKGDLITGGMGGDYRLMGFGAVRAEELDVAPVELALINRKARTDIMLALAIVYEEKGRLYSAYKRDLEKELGLESNIVTGNLIVLDNLGYAKSVRTVTTKLKSRGSTPHGTTKG